MTQSGTDEKLCKYHNSRSYLTCKEQIQGQMKGGKAICAGRSENMTVPIKLTKM